MSVKPKKQDVLLPVEIHYCGNEEAFVYQNREGPQVRFAQMAGADVCVRGLFETYGGFIRVLWPQGRGWTTEQFGIDLENVENADEYKYENPKQIVYDKGVCYNDKSKLQLMFQEASDFYHKKIKDELAQHRQHRLLMTDWRLLRGIPFENFVADVFQELGYAVEKTKTSGDQGVDLVVARAGHRVAIQAKGYDGNVGNGAVQEVHAGMVLYKCHACAVITNSDFTVGAHELAQATGCRLVCGDQIRALIDGRIVI